jgi:hypothetical protein
MSNTLFEDATKAAQEITFAASKLAAYVSSLGRELEECDQSWHKYLQEDEARHQDEIERLKSLIHNFLDLTRRPVGARKYEFLDSDETTNAIAALCDAVGRNP